MAESLAYSTMDAAARLAWGHAESAARQADLTEKTAAALDRAKKNAKARRRLIGASIGQATAMVIAANREVRIAAARAEREVAHG